MKVIKIIGKTIIGIFASIISLALIVVILFNVLKFPIYGEYFAIKEDICINPGLNDGFVCQGIAASEKDDKILVSGYMVDDSHSRIYVTNKKNESYYINLIKNGEKFTGHIGGIATTNGNVYLSNGSKVYTLPLESVLSANNGDYVEIGDGTKVNNNASFIYCDDTYLYVGEFHDAGKYITNHPYQTNDGLYHAICSRYDVNDLSKPNRVYSIRNNVQGICFTPDGKIVLSTSYGLTSSIYYIYEEKDLILSEHTLDDAPVYYVNNLKKEISGPAMSEGLDYYEGKVISLSESASNKYIFGKFFFANYIIGLRI